MDAHLQNSLEIAEFTGQTLQEVLDTPAWINGKIYKRVSLYGTPGQARNRLLLLLAQQLAGSATDEDGNPFTVEQIAPYLKPFLDEARKNSGVTDNNAVDLSKHEPGDAHPFTRSSDIPIEEIMKIPTHMRSLGQMKKLVAHNAEQKDTQESED